MSIHAKKQRIGLCVVICLGFWGLPSSYSLSQVNPDDTIPPEIRVGQLIHLAESHMKNGQIQEAIAAYTEALQYNYLTFELLFTRG